MSYSKSSLRWCFMTPFLTLVSAAFLQVTIAAFVDVDFSTVPGFPAGELDSTSGKDSVIVTSELENDPNRQERNLALLVVSITRTYRVTSVTTTPVTSIARCYRPTTIAICSKKKRELLVIPGPPNAEEEMDSIINQLRLQSIAEMQPSPVASDPALDQLDSSAMELFDEETRTLSQIQLMPEDLSRRRGRLFRPQSYVSSTTLTTTSTYTSTLWGSTIETVSYVNCRAPGDPVAPAC